MTHNSSLLPSTKHHYEVLDGLRGVAAIMVVLFHTCEAFAKNEPFDQLINHGYLAVDFFFLLSGFVIAYAYDDRWQKDDRWQAMTVWQFFKRRLIRLQPMVIFGSLLGAAYFYFAPGKIFPLVAITPVWKLVLVMLLGCTLLPLPVSLDIRGWQEMHPLNGPAWSLYYEYIANILYALGLRKASNRVLAILVLLAALLTFSLLLLPSADPNAGTLIGGWALDLTQTRVGLTRLLFPFLAGMLLMRTHRRLHIPGAFLWCSIVLVGVLAMPHLGGPGQRWMNGLYEAAAVMLVFPAIVATGAGTQLTSSWQLATARLLGAISYPLYITHYGLIYIYTAWVPRAHPTTAQGLVWGALLLIAALTVAYASLKLYDEPLRAWLTRRYLTNPSSKKAERPLQQG